MDRSVLEVILKTCRKMEIPPNPNRNAVKIILMDNFLQAILEIIFIPFVISRKPVNSAEIKLESICKKLNSGVRKIVAIEKIPLAFKIDMMLEKITTKPPISKIVEILLVILSDRTSPRLDKVTVLEFEKLWIVEEEFFVVCCFFQNLKRIPTVIHESKWVINSKIPIVVFLNIKIPTVPIINKGPELFVKLRSLSHSSLEQILFFLNSVDILAPTGYPLIIPIIKAKAPSPGTLKIGRMYLFSKFPI